MIEQAFCIIAFILVSVFFIAFCCLCVYVAVGVIWSIIVDFVKELKRIYLEITA